MAEYEILGGRSFSRLHVTLKPGESITAGSGDMVSMDEDIEMTATLNGGFAQAILLKLFGNESFFRTEFVNKSNEPKP